MVVRVFLKNSTETSTSMADKSVDILSSNSDDEMMSVDDLFSKAFESVETCRKKVENIDRIHTA